MLATSRNVFSTTNALTFPKRTTNHKQANSTHSICIYHQQTEEIMATMLNIETGSCSSSHDDTSVAELLEAVCNRTGCTEKERLEISRIVGRVREAGLEKPKSNPVVYSPRRISRLWKLLKRNNSQTEGVLLRDFSPLPFQTESCESKEDDSKAGLLRDFSPLPIQNECRESKEDVSEAVLLRDFGPWPSRSESHELKDDGVLLREFGPSSEIFVNRQRSSGSQRSFAESEESFEEVQRL